MDVEVDPEEDQRPEQGGQQRRDERLYGVDVLPVVMRVGNDRADRHVDDEQQAVTVFVLVRRTTFETSFPFDPRYPGFPIWKRPPPGLETRRYRAPRAGRKEVVLPILWILVILLVIFAIFGGVAINSLLWLVLIVALVVAVLALL